MLEIWEDVHLDEVFQQQNYHLKLVGVDTLGDGTFKLSCTITANVSD